MSDIQEGCFKVVEVGPRDGLQNERQQIPTSTKVHLIEALANCGLPTVEATSFVSPEWIPQLADAEEVFRAVNKREGTRYPVLVPNLKGFERAQSVGVDEIAVFGAASEAFSHKNINCSIAESLERFRPVIERATEAGIDVRGYVSCVMGCPYQGKVSPDDVLRVTRALLEAGCYEVSLGDTIGAGTAGQARDLIRHLKKEVPVEKLAVHFHDTRGQAIANILVCIDEGIRVADASIAGLGGCPYAPASSGNVATEELVFMVESLGLKTGVDLPHLIDIGRFISDTLDRPNGSKLGRAGLPKHYSR